MDKFIGNNSDSEDDVRDLGSDEEFFNIGKSKAKNSKAAEQDDDESEDDLIDSEGEEEQLIATKSKKKDSKKQRDAFEEEDEEESEDDEEEQEGKDQAITDLNKGTKREVEDKHNLNELFRKSKLTTNNKLSKSKKKGKTGVVYLSKIPPYMKPAKMRQILSRFGEVDRLFLKKETTQKHKKRVQSGGNKKDMYEEGWAEFIRKKDAKLAAETLNGNILGGKKGNFYYDDVMNIKYLSGFKWIDLTQQISKENEIRESKLLMEVSQAKKLNSAFIKNVEKSKMVQNMQSKKRERSAGENGEDAEEQAEQDIRRTFHQRKITSKRHDADKELKEKNNEKLDSVLSRVF
ncbi:hypothetical protein WICPIJ_002429 [Wickerhamomyces pijperi]|uniref:Pre-rRNA-processing protein ESF2 n=1 Tax=Wickerhamomyces pijperi TaxID=599730 RepID=A0A9P8TPT9_WICPI|nr:hypothetical protein WICPIJ_002429 [Wickerhamomyces pijperi]